MPNVLLYLVVVCSAVAALFAVLAVVRVSSTRSDVRDLTQDQVEQAMRSECDRVRAEAADQARGLRQELSEGIRGFQTSTLQAFAESGKRFGDQIKEFGNMLDVGITAIDGRAGAIGTKLDQQLGRMSDEALRGRDGLRQAIEAKLDDSAQKAIIAARELREEVSRAVQTLQESLVTFLGEQRAAEGEQFEGFAKRLTESLAAIDGLLRRGLVEMAATGDARHQGMVQTLDARSKELTSASSETARTLRSELTESFQRLSSNLSETFAQLESHQKERLEAQTLALGSLTEGHAKAQEALRKAVEDRLDAIRSESATKLEEMRQTVNEKLQSTLEKRLGESFKIVSEQLERVHQGVGEMQSLAAGVGDLKRVLSNVKVRGNLGEIQLGTLLEQFLAPDQYIRNAKTSDDSLERVEFAIQMPGGEDGKQVLLPIDAKFPREDFERLVIAAENGDSGGVEAASSALESRLRGCAKSIKDKYINPPRTTDFAILFLATESLYAEVLRRPGLFEHLQREYHVTLAGPTTLTAILNGLQMGFRSLAIAKRSSEVWQILSAIRSEFGKYGEVVDRLRTQLNTAVNTIDTLGTRTRVMNRKLRDVEVLPDAAAQKVLLLDLPDDVLDETSSTVKGRTDTQHSETIRAD
jgi:DNA recombination protein RmuC